jgi:hypothetical protein
MADHDFHPAIDLVEFPRGRPPGGAIDHHRAIHQGRVNFDLGAIKRNESLLIRRDVKIVREDSVGRGWRQLNVGLFDYFRAMLAKPQDDIVKSLVRRRRDLDPSLTLIDTILADLDFANLEIASLGQDLIEHLRKDQGINDMAPEDNGFGKHRGEPSSGPPFRQACRNLAIQVIQIL